MRELREGRKNDPKNPASKNQKILNREYSKRYRYKQAQKKELDILMMNPFAGCTIKDLEMLKKDDPVSFNENYPDWKIQCEKIHAGGFSWLKDIPGLIYPNIPAEFMI